MNHKLRSANDIRADFCAAMSRMYQAEVPAYGQLTNIVNTLNSDVLESNSANTLNMAAGEDTRRITQERHGAIRLGSPQELAMMARVFAVMGMQAVGYYDLSVASVPVHSTAFRPISRADLAANPFRVFTSLLRLELIEDTDLRERARAVLDKRQIFTDQAIALTNKAERDGGLDDDDAALFIEQVLETFRWHPEACVDQQTFAALNAAHRLIADVVSFKGPHINHLTPRTLDIDATQTAMVEQGLPAKAVVEGPPRRACPILLRQTAFKALNEPICFPIPDGGTTAGTHTARFGEVEQRGAALTPKGRALYDDLLATVRKQVLPAADGFNATDYVSTLNKTFEAFPDNWRSLHDQELAYFKYDLAEPDSKVDAETNLATLLDTGVLTLSPIIYEDFLPVSAAGIFQSNLGDNTHNNRQTASSKEEFETALGGRVANEFSLYENIQTESLLFCREQLRLCR